jgi:hypothetical protein
MTLMRSAAKRAERRLKSWFEQAQVGQTHQDIVSEFDSNPKLLCCH